MEKKGKKKTKNKKQKTASSPEQDLHPDWDRFRGTMLYPLSCGELAINGEKILRLYGTRGVHIAWITCTNIPWNAEYLGPKMSFLQKKV